ncbi:MAG: hypothetical protein PVJ06_12630 [Desulfobacterales bacterium]|jgi:hypothetical protein
MNSNSTFSLSLQKQIQKQNVSIDTEIIRAFQELNFRIRLMLKKTLIIDS